MEIWTRTILAANSKACKMSLDGVRISECTQMGPFVAWILRMGAETRKELGLVALHDIVLLSHLTLLTIILFWMR
jgi:hypothetical protein